MSAPPLTLRQRLRQATAGAWFRLRSLPAGRRRESETDEELGFHLEMAVAERVAAGMDPAAARTAVLRELGGLEQVREACRDERGVPWLETTVRDLRWGLRSLARTPSFTVAATAILALGVAALAAVAPVVEAVLLRPLPFPASERLVALWESWPEWGWERSNTAPANLLDWREQVPALERVSGHGFVGGWALGGGGAPERVAGIQVFDGFFAVFGAPMTLGREVAPAELWSNAEPVVVLGHDLWRRRFAADPEVLGRRVELDGQGYTVVGVAPAGFDYPRPGLDLFVPFRFPPGSRAEVWFRRAHFVRGVARLADGASLDEASRQLAAVAGRLARRHPETNEGKGAGMTPLAEWVTGDARRPLAVVGGAVVLLLVVACANLAGLVLARGVARGRELAVRAALGAGRARLVRQLVTEGLLLAAAGGALGAAVGGSALALLVDLAGDVLPRAHEVRPHWGALVFGLAAAAGTVLLFAVGPALRLAGADPRTALGGAGRAHTGGAEVARSRGVLVAAEVALATVLVAGAGLAVQSYRAIVAVEPGFRSAGVVAASYSLPPARYPGAEQVAAFHRRVLARAAALPGVSSASLASSLPLEGSHWTSAVVVEGRPEAGGGGPAPEFNRRIVSPGYFRTLGVRLVAGRGLSAGASERTAAEVVINETLARRHFPGEDPLGRRVDWNAGGRRAWRTIVGVAADERVEGLAAPVPAEILLPVGQEGLDGTGFAERSMTVALASGGGSACVCGVIQRAAFLDVRRVRLGRPPAALLAATGTSAAS